MTHRVKESPSFKWIHRVRDLHYRRTKNLPLEAWLRPAEVGKVVQAFRRLGLGVRVKGRGQLGS